MYVQNLDGILLAKGLTREDLKRPVRIAHLYRIAIRIGDWKSCAALLGISQDFIDDVDEEERGVRNKRIKIFSIWQKWFGDDATYLMLAEILADLQRRDLIELLIDLYLSVPEERSWIDIPDIAEKIKKAASISKAPFILLWKNLKLFVIISAVLTMIVVSMSPTHIDAYNEPEKHSPPTDLAGLFWTNRTRCDSVSHDLPIINSPFVGREAEMSRIIQQMNVARIININGAPGFGKSLLAIHIGYEMIRQGSTVRYIDATDKFSASKYFDMESIQLSQRHSKKQTQAKQAPKSHSLTQKSQSAIARKKLLKNEWMTESTDAVVKNLLIWSKKIQCPTILILDNCDNLISPDTARETLVRLIKQMLQNSKNQLHIIVTSRQQLYVLDDFESLVIKELSKSASIELLQLLAPNISANHSEIVASLVEGCPLALKVVGMLIHKQEDMLSEILQEQLLEHPIQVLDKASIQKDRFGTIMDLVYEQLGYMQQCGHYICLFPGSFAHQAGSEIIPIDNCLETFVEQSLLDKYYVGYQIQSRHHHTHYKMHRLIREYFREKGKYNNFVVRDLQQDFRNRYCNYFTDYMLNLTSADEISEEYLYLYSLETHNIHHFLNLLLPKVIHSIKELIILAYAVGEELISVNSVRNKFPQMMRAIRYICHHKVMKHKKCGQLFSFIIKELYLKCKCNNTYDYIAQIFTCPCKDLFPCSTVAEIYWHPAILVQLSQQEKNFLLRLNQYHCASVPIAMMTPATQVHVLLSSFEYLCFVWIIYHFTTFHGLLKIMLSVQLLPVLMYLFHILHQEWIAWLANYFPFFFLRLKKLIIYSVLTLYLYSGYKRRFVRIYNRTLELQKLKLCDDFFPLFITILAWDFIFDIYIFWRFVPTCF